MKTPITRIAQTTSTYTPSYPYTQRRAQAGHEETGEAAAILPRRQGHGFRGGQQSAQDRRPAGFVDVRFGIIAQWSAREAGRLGKPMGRPHRPAMGWPVPRARHIPIQASREPSGPASVPRRGHPSPRCRHARSKITPLATFDAFDAQKPASNRRGTRTRPCIFPFRPYGY